MVYINTTGKHNEVWLDKPYATITVECPDCPSTEDAYNSGWTDGSEDGYHKGYQSGRTDGYDDGWGPGYESGFTDGLEACSGETIHNQTKSFNILDTGGDLKVKYEYGAYQFENITEDIRPNSGYTGLERVGLYMYIYPGEALQDGFNSGYTSGYTDGLNACSGGSCEGVWEDGYDSGFTDGVNSVECSGYTQEDLDAAFASGYSAGLRDCSGYTPATSITLNVDNTITDFATATTSFHPTTANTDIYYTSSDPSVATVNPDTGVITVVSEGTVTICAIDRLSELQDCKTISTFKNVLSAYGMAIYEVTSTTSPTRILGASGFNSFDYLLYEGRRTDIDSSTVGYTFPATGRQVVYYHFKDATKLKAGTFYKGSTGRIMLPLVAFNLPESVTIIEGGMTFRETALEYFVVPQNLTSLDGEQQFYNCDNLSSFTFENGSALQTFYPDIYGTDIRNISIPDSIKEIGDIQTNRSLTAVTIGTGLTSIETDTFDNCTALQTVTIAAATPPTVKYYPGLGPLFQNCTNLQHIYVPAASVNAYKAATGWSDHASIISAIQ